jgi:hypothetical protein
MMPVLALLPARFRTFLLAAAALASVTAAALAQPQPDPVPTRWEFRFDAGPLRTAIVNVPGVGQRVYFYLTYRITNNWDTDLLFAPDAMLRVDDGELVRSGRDVPPAVTREILARLNNPLVQDQVSVVGQVLQGPENARDGVLIWPAVDLDVDEISVFFAGLSGETRAYTVGEGDAARRFLLRKTALLRYDTAGEFGQRDNAELTLAERTWVMR